MTRSKPGRGRTTPQAEAGAGRPGRSTERFVAGEPDIAPLYKRRPATFIFVLVAVLAMVLSMMVGIIDAVI